MRPLTEIGKKPIPFNCIDILPTAAFGNLYKQGDLCHHAQAMFAVNMVPIERESSESSAPGYLKLTIVVAPWSHSSNGNPDFFTCGIELKYVRAVALPEDVAHFIAASSSPTLTTREITRMVKAALIFATLWHEEKTGVFSEPPHPGEFESIIDNVLNKFVIDYEKAKPK